MAITHHRGDYLTPTPSRKLKPDRR